jgi:hypothetical protein
VQRRDTTLTGSVETGLNRCDVRLLLRQSLHRLLVVLRFDQDVQLVRVLIFDRHGAAGSFAKSLPLIF